MFDRCLYFNSHHLSRSVGKIWSDAYSELDLAPAHAYLLRLLLEKPGMTQKQIANELHLEKSTITRFVDKMEVEGYLTRGGKQDLSAKSPGIYPTNKSKKIAKRLNEIGDELYAAMQAAVSKDDLGMLVAMMRQTAKKL